MVVKVDSPEVDAHVMRKTAQVYGPVKTLHRQANLGQVKEGAVEEEEDDGLRHKVWIAEP